MYSIEGHKTMDRILSLLYFFGIWQSEKRSRFAVLCIRLLYFISYGYVVIAIALGSFTTDDENEVVFLAVLAIVAFVVEIRLYYFLWAKDDILRFIRKLGIHSIKDSEEFQQIKDQINYFMKFVSVYEVSLFLCVSTMAIITLPLFSSDTRLPLSYYFPFDWRGNVFFYIIAYLFVIYGLMFTSLFTIFNSIIWYLMLSCAIKYRTLGNEFRCMGLDRSADEKTTADADGKHDVFLLELIASIKKHKDLQETTDEFKSFFSNIFLIQILTSGIAICGAVYALATASMMNNPIQYGIYFCTMMYSLFDIFMVTYFGNEIKFASGKLHRCVFECNWIEQSRASKSCILVLHEVLKQPQVLVMGTLYALDLEMFSNILNFAYSQFNLLKSMQL